MVVTTRRQFLGSGVALGAGLARRGVRCVW